MLKFHSKTVTKYLTKVMDYVALWVDLIVAIIGIFTLGKVYINWDINFRCWYVLKIIKLKQQRGA
jgi:hypothetical protein